MNQNEGNGKISIQVKDIFKSYGKVQALQGVTLEMKKGQIFGLLGPNGAGKTTLVRILTTLIAPTKGSATVGGFDIVKNPNDVRTRIGLAGQYAAVDEILTGFENLVLTGRLYHMSRSKAVAKARALLDDFDLTFAAHRALRTYSGGMRRRLDLAASLMGDPEVLFLDEPTTGLDPHSRAELWQMLKRLRASGTTILLTTQYLEEADYLSDMIAVINNGKVIANGTPLDLKSELGQGVLELHIKEKEITPTVAALVRRLGEEKPDYDVLSGRVTLKVLNGTQTLVEAIRLLDTAKVELDDIYLRKPTLDEVFIELTGRPEAGVNTNA